MADEEQQRRRELFPEPEFDQLRCVRWEDMTPYVAWAEEWARKVASVSSKRQVAGFQASRADEQGFLALRRWGMYVGEEPRVVARRRGDYGDFPDTEVKSTRAFYNPWLYVPKLQVERKPQSWYALVAVDLGHAWTDGDPEFPVRAAPVWRISRSQLVSQAEWWARMGPVDFAYPWGREAGPCYCVNWRSNPVIGSVVAADPTRPPVPPPRERPRVQGDIFERSREAD